MIAGGVNAVLGVLGGRPPPARARIEHELVVDAHPQRLRATRGLVLPADDQVIFLAAMAARATPLLTGDKTHFGRYYGRTRVGVLILPPRVYLRG